MIVIKNTRELPVIIRIFLCISKITFTVADIVEISYYLLEFHNSKLKLYVFAMLKIENDWKLHRNDINNFFTVFRIYTNIFRIFRQHLVGTSKNLYIFQRKFTINYNN
jgi:hypothetical protein